ncbi:DUF3231 family protein [Aquisalibacillus elongatus]|uniref:Uncharacterized protein DUF3231 n=1 Tax=Aquisalibacillus elongatus TaxID=485577 RepID=A0A3N5B0H9_9BACI|nr:DUF3231 family protein [Aquisalibacillus elongatus]RPF51066.1 uncharacterized protein DUF3231 [Aquisalibacillus elongatus]
MPESPKISSSEIGVLWITYQQNTMILRMLEYFIEHADDDQAKQILVDVYEDIKPYATKIENIFQTEGAAIPVGFKADDVNIGAPKLFDNGFDILFIRLMKEISMGMHTLNLNMCYRPDIVMMMRELTNITQRCYDKCTEYLLEKGILTRSPYVQIPKNVEFVQEVGYLSGFNLFKEKRPLNVVETAHLHHTIESNMVGMQLILGFSQCANEKEVKQYLGEGAAISKEIIKTISNILLDSSLQVPSTPGGNVTGSTVPPFSDKMMMYCVSLFCSFAIGGSSLGTAFSQRNDLVEKITKIMQDIFAYAHKGAKLMIQHGWLEEPPQTKNNKKSPK